MTVDSVDIELGENITAYKGVILLDAGADFDSYLWVLGIQPKQYLFLKLEVLVTVNSSSCEGTDNIDVEFTNIRLSLEK